MNIYLAQLEQLLRICFPVSLPNHSQFLSLLKAGNPTKSAVTALRSPKVRHKSQRYRQRTAFQVWMHVLVKELSVCRKSGEWQDVTLLTR